VLACYHVISKNNKIPDKKNFNIYFADTKDARPSEIIEGCCSPFLDIAFLQLQEKKYQMKL
jgi:hypothetical protein